MVELATTTPLQDNGIAQAPFQLISSLLATVKSLLGENWPRPPEMNELTESYSWLLLQKDSLLPQTVLEDLLSTLSPLLERQQPSEEMCTAFSRHCQSHPRSSLVRGLFTSIVQRILKHNVVRWIFATQMARWRCSLISVLGCSLFRRISGNTRTCAVSSRTTSECSTLTTMVRKLLKNSSGSKSKNIFFKCWHNYFKKLRNYSKNYLLKSKIIWINF